jgi:H+/Cl- antiporter ClcA
MHATTTDESTTRQYRSGDRDTRGPDDLKPGPTNDGAHPGPRGSIVVVVRRLISCATALVGGDALLGANGWLLLLVVFVGLASGLTAACFVAVLRLLTAALGPEGWSTVAHAVVLGSVGFAIGALTLVLGNPGDVELLVNNIHVSGGRSDIRDLRSLIPVSLLGIAAGSAIGPEAPLVQTTGSIGSWVGLRLGLDRQQMRLLTISGMAAGFTVLLGVPLGSAVFALEILHRRGLEYYEALLPAVVGSLVGYGVYLGITSLGLQPAFTFPTIGAMHATDLLLGIALGGVGAVLAALFTFNTRLCRNVARRLPVAARPVAGGLVLAGLAVLTPFALTFGEEQINQVAASKMLVSTLILAGLVKLFASSMLVTAGWRGGFIIPLFFVGVTLGSAMAETFGLNRVVTITALMAATTAGVTKTPLGSTLVVSEMAGLAVLPSTLVASVVALLLTSSVGLIESQRRREGEVGPQVEAQAETGVAEAFLRRGAGRRAEVPAP